MNVSAHTLRRLVSVTGLAAFIAVLAVPTALARHADVDGNTMYRTPVVFDVRSPDTLDATAQASVSGVDPAIATAIAAHKRLQGPADLRSPDTLAATAQVSASGLDPAIATAMAARKGVPVSGDLRSPDARDVGASPMIQDSPTVTAPVTSDGFNWSRFAIVLAAIGAALAGIGVLVLLSHKHTGHGKGAGSVTAA